MLNTFGCLLNIRPGMSCKKIFFHLLGGEKVLRVGENLSLVMRRQLIADFYDFLALSKTEEF